MTDNYGGYYLSPPSTNNGLYFFTESPLSVQGFVLWACYDNTGNGVQLTPQLLRQWLSRSSREMARRLRVRAMSFVMWVTGGLVWRWVPAEARITLRIVR